jgi:hypothetical protein
VLGKEQQEQQTTVEANGQQKAVPCIRESGKHIMMMNRRNCPVQKLSPIHLIIQASDPCKGG